MVLGMHGFSWTSSSLMSAANLILLRLINCLTVCTEGLPVCVIEWHAYHAEHHPEVLLIHLWQLTQFKVTGFELTDVALTLWNVLALEVISSVEH